MLNMQDVVSTAESSVVPNICMSYHNMQLFINVNYCHI